MRHRGVVESARHEQQGIAALEEVEVLAADALRLPESLRRGGYVDVLNLGMDDALRFRYLGEHIEAEVGHFGNADVGLRPTAAEGCGLGVAARHGVEDGGLAGERQAEYADGQGADLTRGR